MKIYLATTAPGTEQVQPDGFVKVPYRLLSYYHITKQRFGCGIVFPMKVPGREIELSKLIGKWNRLYSYYYIIDSKRVEQSFIDITQINKK